MAGMPNDHLRRLFAESGWTLSQWARAVNLVGSENGTPLRYNASAAHHWLGGTTPRTGCGASSSKRCRDGFSVP